MQADSRKVALITGCSTGIGSATAKQLAEAGLTVYATARRAESVKELQKWADKNGPHVHADTLDVTIPEHHETVLQRILNEQGRIDVLVNNAGFGQPGSVEDIPAEKWRYQFEVNLFGLIDLTRLVLPHMREQRSGRIINVSSVVAHVNVPFMSAYVASKHALDAINTGLRQEVRPWGIDVVSIEPGPIDTQFFTTAHSLSTGSNSRPHTDYSVCYEILERATASENRFGMATPDDVARVICRAITTRRPRTRYRITAIARLAPALTRILPDRWADALTLRAYSLHKFRPTRP